MTDNDHTILFTFLFLMTIFAGTLYFVGQELWMQDQAFDRMAQRIDTMLHSLNH